MAARRTRATIKGNLRAGRIVGQDVLRLADTDSEAGRAAARMTIAELLLSLPGVGRVRADAALVAAGISGSRRLGALGPRQRECLAEVLQ
jgi:guanylate kinase